MDRRTTDDLEQTLLATEAVIARSRAVQIAVLAELDRRQVSTADGCRSMVEWTASRLDVAPETASALIRTSRAVLDTPEVAEALIAGEITFDRAVELCRYAATGVDNTVETGWRFDIGGLRREVSRRHRFSRDREHESVCDRYLAMQPNLDQTSWRLWGLLPGVDGQIVEQALIRRADTFPPLPDGTRSTLGQRQADALTSIAQDSLTATAGEGTCTPLVTVFVDVGRATQTQSKTDIILDSGVRIGPDALDGLLCDSQIETILTTDGTPLAVGGHTRTINPALRRAILHRDAGVCTADACTSRYRLQAHHITPYSRGGPTDQENLTTLCWYHHHVVIHGMGYRIDPDTPHQRRRFLKPNGNDPP